MHRHGSLVLRPQQTLGRVRRASTAAKLKPRQWDSPNAAPQYPGPSAATSSTAAPSPASKAAALRASMAKMNSRPPSSEPRSSDPWSTPRQASGGYRAGTPQRNSDWASQNQNFAHSFRNDTRQSTQHHKGRDIRPQQSPSTAANFPQTAPPDSTQQYTANRPTTTAQTEHAFISTSLPVDIPSTDEPLKNRPVRVRYDSKFKERGSLLQDDGRHTQSYSNKHAQARNVEKPKPVKASFKQAKKQRELPPVYIPTAVSVVNLARILGIKPARLQRKMEQVGITDNASYDYVLTADYAALLAEEYGRKPIVDDEAAFDLYPPAPHPEPSTLPLRPPVVTIMGHVDHGKTTLLDTLRSAAVAKGEAGGITQHIGAFSVPVQSESTEGVKSITFLDTPGHAAFSAIRARGAGVTDTIVLVVAADDGLMPQTKEVIELYKKHQDSVGLVVAINKVDKPAADVEAVEKALMAEGIQLESYGGDIPAVHVSGLTGQGLPDLIETLSALAEMQDLRAEDSGLAYGEILESKVQQGLGTVGTVLVMRGCLKVGSHILSGQSYAKVRRMTDSNGRVVKLAKPGMAVTVSGWKTLPQAGDNIIEGSESDVKKALNNRVRRAAIDASLSDVDAINESRRHDREKRLLQEQSPTPNASRNQHFEEINTDSGKKELRLVIKADVSGSAEAVEGALQGIGNNVAMSRIISTGVGDVSESDVMLAKAANATIVAFSVGVPRSVQSIANQNAVPICTSNIIYKLMDDVRERVRSLLPVVIESKVTGEANVLQLFDIHLKGKAIKKVAGCRVTNGLVEKSKFARVVRNGEIIHEGSLDTMKHLKKDVTEIRKGMECGLSFGDFADVREGDIIQMFERIEKPAVL
ncbi:translation initiation factor IF-2 [Coprinopsis cinerea okayama7|uniref:Translation initiation factor IF-2, mitochondrial n=1 Tax=Coprinopsis cinerea (strain Okayama-7 / 130 / ATCC MYA-4618 / FGSC 9003) TaxID=240176 RepID=A8NGB6_COPC7|nr:translation initiation factor IF-2 [Coprinopsis cinerea okayama7\|eukprot:XP_001833397.2 translation initiation factor IF-2 [Coprinopsis cinerea okayama7\